MSRLPRNGENLLNMRREGNKPEGVTLVSFVGSLPHSNFTVYAEPGDACDWTPLAGLEIEVLVNASMPMPTVLRQLSAIASAAPEHMVLTYVEGPRIDCGQARYSLQAFNPNTGRMLFDWFPMAIGPSHLADASKIEKRLWRALDNEIPIPFDASEKRLVNRMNKELGRGASNR
jgi:hypothetical protein